MDQEEVFCEGSETKEVFSHHKNIGSKNNQNLHFCDVVHQLRAANLGLWLTRGEQLKDVTSKKSMIERIKR